MYKKEFKLVEYLSILDKNLLSASDIQKYLNETKLNIDNILFELSFHKITPQVFSNINYLENEHDLRNDFLYAVKERILKRNPIIYDKEKQQSALHEAIIEVINIEKDALFIKGTALQNLYNMHTDTYRHSNDVDIIFPKIDNLFSYLLSMIGNGYYMRERSWLYIKPIIFNKDGTKEINIYDLRMLHIHLCPPESKQHKKAIDAKFSVHVFLPTKELISRKIESSICGKTYWIPSNEDNIYILCKHCMEHGFLKLSWINDLYLYCTHATVNWSRVYSLLEKEGMTAMFCSLINYTGEIYKNFNSDEFLNRNIANGTNIKSKYFSLLFRKRSNISPLLIELECISKRVKRTIVVKIIQIIKIMHYISLRTKEVYDNSAFTKIINVYLIKRKIINGGKIILPLKYKIEPSSKIFNKKENDIILKVVWDKNKGFRLINSLVTFVELKHGDPLNIDGND